MSEQNPSHLRAALQVVARGLRARSGAAPDALRGPRRRVAVECASIVIDPRRVERFRRVTGDVYGGRSAIPPVYSSTWETALALELFAGEELPVPTGGLVHLESELVVLRPIRIEDRIRSRIELDRSEPHRRGLLVTLLSRNWNAAGQLCQENSLTFLVRTRAGERKGELGGERAPPGRERAAPAAGWTPLADWRLSANLGRRYARASGDFNPIHLWKWSSRLLGFDRPIAHGFCTEAMVAAALTGRLWGGDPTALRRLHLAFRAPLELPCDARVEVTRGASGSGRIRVVGTEGADGRVFAEGEFLGEL